MSIYTSTKTPSSPKKKKQPSNKPRVKINGWLVCGVCYTLIFVLCILPFGLFRNFFTGVFGLVIYPMSVGMALISYFLAMVKKYTIHRRYVVMLSSILFVILCFFHLILTRDFTLSSYGHYLAQSYKSGSTAGGLLLSIIMYPVVKFLGKVGSYITLAIVLCILISLLADYIVRQKYASKKTQISTLGFVPIDDIKQQNPITLDAANEKDKAEIARIKLGLKRSNATIISSDMPDVSEKRTASRPEYTKEYILTPPEPVIPSQPKNDDMFIHQSSTANAFEAVKAQYGQPKEQNIEQITDYSAFTEVRPIKRDPSEINNFTRIEKDNRTYYNRTLENKPTLPEQEPISQEEQPDFEPELYNELPEEELSIEEKDRLAAEALSGISQPQHIEDYVEEENIEPEIEEEPAKPEVITNPTPVVPAPQPITQSAEYVDNSKPEHKPYIKPPMSLLKEGVHESEDDSEKVQRNIELLEQALENFKVPAKVIAVTKGPAVTRYELSMPTGISVKKIESYADDIAYALASNGSVRIEAPIPGKPAVGIEVPNDHITPVYFQEIVSSKDFWLRPSPISMALGKDISGNIQYCNLDKLYHVLVAGSTGSGKSVCLNTMLLSMIYKSSPEDLRIILVDPKRVEFSSYEGLPHLLTPHVITEKAQALNALNWAIKEMERRYVILQRNHVVNIKEYNNLPFVQSGALDKMPYIIIVIDELADLMSENKREIEERLMRLAQKARASGIHLIVATQRPSVDVITGTIKTNFPSRIAFALTNFADSKTVLDGSGAEKLLGKGDMLFKPNDAPEPRRVQGAYVSSEEVNAVVDFVKHNNEAYYDANIEKEIFAKKDESSVGQETNNALDPLIKAVLRYFIETNSCSASSIQRRFSVGFVRAGRIMDQLEQHKLVTRQEGSKPRQVTISLEDIERMFPDN